MDGIADSRHTAIRWVHPCFEIVCHRGPEFWHPLGGLPRYSYNESQIFVHFVPILKQL